MAVVTALWGSVAWADPSSTGLTATEIKAQPNLMILLSNSASMSLNMTGTNLATSTSSAPLENQCPANYPSSSDYLPVPTFNDGACGGTGTPFPYGQYGNQPNSRFYIAKQALYHILNSNYAQNINLGFATYRQAFGLMASAVSQSSNAVYPNIYLPGQAAGAAGAFPSPYDTYTSTQLANVGYNPLNFAFVSWWPVYNSTYTGLNDDGNAFIGNGLNGSSNNTNGQPPFNSSGLFDPLLTTYLNNAAATGGLPYSVAYPQGTQQNTSVSSGAWLNSYYGGGGLTPQQASSGAAQPVLNLCQTFYNSQANTFQAIYTENAANGNPILFQQTFPNTNAGNTLYYVTLGSPPFQNGSISNNAYSQICNVANTPSGAAAPTSVQIASGEALVSNQFNLPSGESQNAYFSYIPNWLSGTSQSGSSLNLNPGQADGWSGATTVNSGTISASYPATPQSESILDSWNWAGAQWMGTFVNLPSSSHAGKNAGNNAPIIAALVNPAYPMENASGLQYSYSNQTIGSSSGSRSIANSSMSASYDGRQEPLYDALNDAYAYWQAFENNTQNGSGVSACYRNDMLVIFDGISDGHSGDTASQEQTALIATAKALYDNLGVKIYVIIISQNAGDVTQANALASAGGTGTAFQVTNASQLANALQSTFISVAGQALLSGFSTPPTLQAGNYAFAPLRISQPHGQGDLNAYQVLSTGQLNSTASLTPSWDAEALMKTLGAIPVSTTNISTSSGFYSGGETSLTTLASGSNAAGLFQTSATTPSPSTIAAYTENPSTDSGAYLGGRTSGWFVGLPSGAKPVVVTPPNNFQLFADNGYQGFAQGHASRENAVLYSGNDGLLTAIGYASGSTPNPTVLWSWMPSGLIPQLQNYGNFWSGDNMAGGFTELDSSNGSSTPSWRSYVVGAAQNGQIVYDLQLSGKSSPGLARTVAEYDLGSDYSQTIAGNPATYWNSNGQAYAAWSLNYSVSGTPSSSGVFLMNVSSGAGVFIKSPSTLTSMPIFGDGGNLYVGAGSSILELGSSTLFGGSSSGNSGHNGGIASKAVVGTSWPTLTASSVSWQTLSDGGLTDMMPFPGNANTNIQWLQESYSGGSYWFTAESSNGITAIQQSNGSWVPQWYSATTGAGRNGASGFTAQPANSTASNAIPTLPSNAVVTDAALVAGGAVYLPVSVPPSGDSCGLTSAYYYLFQLNNGAYPSGLVTDLTGTPETGPLIVGYGNALTPNLSFMNGRPIIQSASSNTNGSKVFPATTSAGLPLGGPVAWRLDMTQ
ncbi:MAG: pilus assembly protein [Acidithiobacillus ferrivorans]